MVCAIALTSAVGGIASAEEPDALDGVRDDFSAPLAQPFRLVHHGSFRFRPELIAGGDLGTGTSGVPQILDDTDPPSTSGTLAWASVRLRWESTFVIGSQLEIHLGIDALDNVILGSTHVNAGGNFAEGLWADAAASPSAGLSTWSDAIEVRQAWARWKAFELLEVFAGRKPDHFGLGLDRNDGSCVDCDFGTIIDLLGVGLTLGPIRFEGTWEYSASGAISSQVEDDPGGGQPYDLGQDDDVTTFSLRLMKAPIGEAEERAAKQPGKLWYNWAVFSSFREQNRDASLQPDPSNQCEPRVAVRTGNVLDYDCYQLIPRDAFFWRPGVWFELELHPDFDSRLHIELEIAALVGDIVNVQQVQGLGNTTKSFEGVGGALELEYTTGPWTLGLMSGFATGDDRNVFGYSDGNGFIVFDDAAYDANSGQATNQKVTSYWFNRDYRVDLILFRQVIGGITNAYYVKPWFSRRLLDSDALQLDARLDVLYAGAMVPEGTPGGGQHYGVEIDAHAQLRVGGLEATLSAGVLLPFGSGLDRVEDKNGNIVRTTPDPAFALRVLLNWAF